MESAAVALLLSGVQPSPLYAYGKPYFLFDTLRSQYMINSGGIYNNLASVPGYSFTRASTGYAENRAGNLVSFASGVPRITDKGYLAEGARTNVLLWSQDFSDAAWPKTNLTVTGGQPDPAGGLTAQEVRNTSVGVTTLYQQITAVASRYVFSVFAKKVNTSTFATVVQDITAASVLIGAQFNFDTGVATVMVGSGEAFMIPLANGFFWCIAVSANAASAGNSIRNYLQYTGGSYTDTRYILWGAQLEAASFPSSYIPTTTGSVTRAADVLSFGSLSGLAAPLTVYSEWDGVNYSSGSTQVAVGVENGSTNNDCARVGPSSNGLAGRYDVRSANVAEAGASVGTLGANGLGRMALRVALNDVNAALLGTLGVQDTSAALPTTLNRINIGYSNQSGTSMGGYIRRAVIWPTAFSDANLQAVTT